MLLYYCISFSPFQCIAFVCMLMSGLRLSNLNKETTYLLKRWWLFLTGLHKTMRPFYWPSANEDDFRSRNAQCRYAGMAFSISVLSHSHFVYEIYYRSLSFPLSSMWTALISYNNQMVTECKLSSVSTKCHCYILLWRNSKLFTFPSINSHGAFPAGSQQHRNVVR